MNKTASFELCADNSVLYVYDSALNFGDLNHGADHILTQGFSGHPRSYKFFTLGECTNLKVEVWSPEVGCKQPEIVLRDDTVRAVMVPFSLNHRSKVAVSHMLGILEVRFGLRSNREYALVFEIKLRDDAEYLNSSEYQQDVEGGFTQECCYLTFYPREETLNPREKPKEPLKPEILRADAWEAPPYLFNRYTPLIPRDSLILDDQPTQPLPLW
jgi:hypothetical protein